jgi:transposase-like protein
MTEQNLEKGICSPKTGYFLEFKIKVVEELKKGHLTKAQISRKYGIKGHSTVSNWSALYRGDIPYFQPYEKYPLPFKLQIVREVQTGLISRETARRKYKIPGKMTVSQWIRKFGSTQGESSMSSKKQKNKTKKEMTRLEKLQLENATLQQKLKESELEVLCLEQVIKIGNELYQVDLKKKSGSMLSSNSQK